MLFLSRRRMAAPRPVRVRPRVVSRPQVEALEDRDLPSAGTLTSEFRVNTTTTNSQYEADTASALNGQSVVVWTDKSASNSNPNIKTKVKLVNGKGFVLAYNASGSRQSTTFTWMTTPDPFSYALPAGVWVTLGLAILTSILLRYTVFGRHVFALGSNEATARLCGVPTTRLKVMIYALAGCFFGLAGVFQLSRLRQGDPTVAVGLELDIIAAVIIGGASFFGGVGSVGGTLIGALVIGFLRNGLNLLDVSAFWQMIVIGVVIVAAVTIDVLRQRVGRDT